MIEMQPIPVRTGSKDREGRLVLFGTELVAVLVRLDDEMHGEDRGQRRKSLRYQDINDLGSIGAQERTRLTDAPKPSKSTAYVATDLLMYTGFVHRREPGTEIHVSAVAGSAPLRTSDRSGD